MNEEYATTDGTGEVDNRPLIEQIGDKVNVTCFLFRFASNQPAVRFSIVTYSLFIPCHV